MLGALGSLGSLHAWLTSLPPLVLAVALNTSPDPSLPTLRYADDDAVAAVRLFGDNPDRTWLLTVMDPETQRRLPAFVALSRPPTLPQLRAAVQEVAQAAAAAQAKHENRAVMVWLAGHAAFDDQGHVYYPLLDTRLGAAQLQKEILEPLAGVGRVHLVVDTCHAGALVQSRAQKKYLSAADAERKSLSGGLARFPNVGTLLATTPANQVYEWEGMQSGVFSALVRSALRGAADANGDGVITYDEVAAFAGAAVQAVPAEKARPRVTARAPAMDLASPLAAPDWFEHNALFQSPASQLGMFRIEDGAGQWVAGGLWEPMFLPVLHLPKQEKLFYKTATSQAALHLNDNGSFELESAQQDATAMARGTVDEALRTGLFQVPFGPAYLRGFQAALQPFTDAAASAAAPQVRKLPREFGAPPPAPQAPVAQVAPPPTGVRVEQAVIPWVAPAAFLLWTGLGVLVAGGGVALALAAPWGMLVGAVLLSLGGLAAGWSAVGLVCSGGAVAMAYWSLWQGAKGNLGPRYFPALLALMVAVHSGGLAVILGLVAAAAFLLPGVAFTPSEVGASSLGLLAVGSVLSAAATALLTISGAMFPLAMAMWGWDAASNNAEDVAFQRHPQDHDAPRDLSLGPPR